MVYAARGGCMHLVHQEAIMAELEPRLKQEVPPLTLANILKATKNVINWRDLCRGFDIDHNQVIDSLLRSSPNATHKECIEAVIVAFLQGDGGYQPTWRAVIHALLYESNGPYLALDETLRSYSEELKDHTFQASNVIQVLNKISSTLIREYLMSHYVPTYQLNEIRTKFSDELDRTCEYAAYIVDRFRDPSWESLNVVLYNANELLAAKEAKSHLLKDPTLKVDNVLLVMNKIDSENRLTVWALLLFPKYRERILNVPKRNDPYYADIYIACHPHSSWVHLAKRLYSLEQVAAVEEVQHYLPLRDLTITTEKLKDLFASVHHEENVDRIGRNLHLPQSKIDLVKRNYRNPLERKEAYLDLYVHDHPCPSWKEIARILYAFRLSQQADMVYTIYIKVSEKTQMSFDAAMMDGEAMMRNGTVLLIGPGGSGKSCTLAAILEEDAPSTRESTPCAKTPVRAIAYHKMGVNNDRFVRITDDQYSDMLVATAEHYSDTRSSATSCKPTMKQVEIPDITDVVLTVPNALIPDEKKSELPAAKLAISQVSARETWHGSGSLRREFYSRMQAGIKKSDLKDKDILDLDDTGGQPMFHEVLPVFIRNTMFGILTVKLNENLNSYPLIEYYSRGVPVGEPFESPFTHLETIHHCMKVICSTCERKTRPKIAFVGTHKDLEHECPHEDRTHKDGKLRSLIPKEMKDNVMVSDKGSILLAINAKSPGVDDQQVLSDLRAWIMKELRMQKPVKIPLRYSALEMAFRRLAKYQRKSILSKEECFQEAILYNFSADSFEAALKYLHGLKLIFYYEEILPDVVFIDAQAILDKITELVVYSLSKLTGHFLSSGMSLGSLEKFKQCGIITLAILSKFNTHYIPEVFEEKHLVLLLKYLKIIAEINEDEYFMPCLLKKDSSIVHHLPVTGSQVASALIFYFGRDGPKLGVFCFLLVSLITEAKWNLLEKDGCPVQVSRNRVRFALPGGNPGCVTITDSFTTFFHVSIEPPEGVGADTVHQICQNLCPSICETVLTAIRKASQKLNYHDLIPEVAFPCMKHEDLHPATLSNSGLLTCTNNPQICSEMTKQNHIWLSQEGTPTDNTTEEIETGVTDSSSYKITVSTRHLQLIKWKDDQGETQRFYLMDKISHKWRTLGELLRLSFSQLHSLVVEHRDRHEECCRAVLGHWLDNPPSDYPATWQGLLELLEDCQLGQVACDLRVVLNKANIIISGNT